MNNSSSVRTEFVRRPEIHKTEASVADSGGVTGAGDMVLVAVAKNGSDHAFDALVDRHAGRILRVAQYMIGNREDAEDIVQQSFQKAFIHLRKFEGRSSFSTWLTRIAINEALMWLRTNRRTNLISIDERTADDVIPLAEHIPDLGQNPERSYSQQEQKRILSFAMDQLTPEIRAAIQLYELDERSLKESAQMMGVSVAAAKSRVLRGRRKLRETLMMGLGPNATSRTSLLSHERWNCLQ